MASQLYDCVPVHGTQGLKGPTKAYACANCMEFFAELSVAYLYRNPGFGEVHASNVKESQDIQVEYSSSSNSNNDNTSNNEHEYNKWYPHNAQQLLVHDPQTYSALEKVWHKSEESTEI
jgi:hypothetical protein